MTTVEGPMPADDLSDRIATALRAEMPSTEDLTALVVEVERELAQIRTDRARSEALSLSPTLSSHLALEAREEAEGLLFQERRLTQALQGLKARLDAVEQAKADEARAEEVERVTKDRDALAAELSETYPVLAHQLADLLQRLEDHAKETAKV